MSLSEDSVVCVELKYNDQVIDQSYIECIKDGSDGVSITEFVLSNDFDQIYVVDNKITIPQKYRINVEKYKGSEW
jgi:hypothetical protein